MPDAPRDNQKDLLAERLALLFAEKTSFQGMEHQFDDADSTDAAVRQQEIPETPPDIGATAADPGSDLVGSRESVASAGTEVHGGEDSEESVDATALPPLIVSTLASEAESGAGPAAEPIVWPDAYRIGQGAATDLNGTSARLGFSVRRGFGLIAMGVKCPRCNNSLSLDRVRRRLWMWLIPFLMYFRCADCTRNFITVGNVSVAIWKRKWPRRARKKERFPAPMVIDVSASKRTTKRTTKPAEDDSDEFKISGAAR